MPEISIIVPVYKVEQYLSKCISSILCQTFTDFELFLVDDGSPDRCGIICDEYAQKDPRIRVIHKENKGVSAARNAALQYVSGRFVTFCDSDDFYSPEWLDTLYSQITLYEADWAIGSYVKVFDSNIEPIAMHHDLGVYETRRAEDRIKYCYYHVFGRKHGWEVWCRLFRADIIRNNAIRFCETCENFAEDLVFVLEYALHAKRVVSFDVPGYHYLVRSGSMMDTSIGKVKLNAVNEASIYFAEVFSNVTDMENHRHRLPIFHFLFMFNQYFVLCGTPQYCNMKQELKNIYRYSNWKASTKKLFSCRRELTVYFGRYNAGRMLLLSHYCIHGNWKRFCLESAIFYRINRPD